MQLKLSIKRSRSTPVEPCPVQTPSHQTTAFLRSTSYTQPRSLKMELPRPVDGIAVNEPVCTRIERLGSQIEALARDNRDFFEKSSSESGQRIRSALDTLLTDIPPIVEAAKKIDERAAKFDFDVEVQGNGYRSFLYVVEKCLRICLPLLRDLRVKRASPVFNKSSFHKELEAWVQVVDSLNWLSERLLLLHSWCKPGSLFPHEYHSAAELIEDLGNFNQYCFYGRALGFQYDPAMRRLLTVVATLLAAFSEVYFHPNQPNAIQRAYIWTSRLSKYSRNPEQRAKRILNASQNCTVDFLKQFWDLNENELLHQFPRVFFHHVDVNEVIKIPTERLEMEKLNGEKYVVPVPHSHIGKQSISSRLLCTKLRTGMINDRSIWRRIKFTKAHEPSKGLIIHCHGGGFVSHSSASQEVFLCEWATILDVPILSIDYSLAPEAPYPRALEEVFYAYCWALKNASLLGTTAERVVFAGDSAGGNIVVGVTMKCIETGIRVPDGLFAIYTPFLVSFTPSPSRLLCLMDTLIPFPFMMRCLGAYAGHAYDDPHFRKFQAESKRPLPELAPKSRYFGEPPEHEYRASRNVFGQKLDVNKPFHVSIPESGPDYFKADGEKDQYVNSFVKAFKAEIDDETIGEDELIESNVQENLGTFEAEDSQADTPDSAQQVEDDEHACSLARGTYFFLFNGIHMYSNQTRRYKNITIYV